MERWGVSDIIAEQQTEKESGTATGDASGGVAISDLMHDAPLDFQAVTPPGDALATIVYTSGTTSQPKGVCLTHENLVANAIQARHWISRLQYGKETVLTVIPLLHSYGMTTGMNLPIAMGATMVLLPVFEVQQVLEHIRDYKPTMVPGVPSMYAAINQASKLRDYGLSSVQACISGAAPLPVEVQEAFEKLTQGRLAEGYGLTEATTVTHANPMYGRRKTGSIGVPVPNTDAKIVDLASGEEAPAGQLGELVVRGPQVMKGYWKMEEETATVLKDGWLYTGDVAVMDEEGYFQIIGRMRDTIMAGSFSVYPRDVEEVLYENSKVQEVAVVGVAHAESGQKVKAFVVPRPGTNLSKEELIDLCQRRLDEYAVPWDIEFREELPKSFVGKVIRRMLVEE
jgi:long-chain acyl-CoA synthetase